MELIMKTSSVYKKYNRKGSATARNQNGIVLILSLVFLCILALLGSTAVMLTTTDMKIGGNYKSSTQAFSAAQAGIAENAIAPERFRCRIRLRRGYGHNRRSIVVGLYSDIGHLDHRR